MNVDQWLSLIRELVMVKIEKFEIEPLDHPTKEGYDSKFQFIFTDESGNGKSAVCFFSQKNMSLPGFLALVRDAMQQTLLSFQKGIYEKWK